jgi:hypothetical protein
MKLFIDILKDINNRLDLPQPARSRVLLEISADLEDMYRHFRERGETAEESRRLALDHCDLSDTALRELVSIHTSAWRRFLDRFSDQAQTRWERIFLSLLLVFVAAAAGRLVFSVDIFLTAGAWVWPVLIVTGATLVASAIKYYMIFIKKDHNTRRLRAGLPVVLYAAGVNLVLGVYGQWFGLYRATVRATEDLDAFWFLAVSWLLQSASLLAVSFLTALLPALFWFFLTNRIARIEQAESSALLAE